MAEDIKIIHGDCRIVVPTLQADSVDHVITDPPYSEIIHRGARTSINEKLIDFDSISLDELRDVLTECGRVSRRWVIATIDWRHMLGLESDPPAGLRFVRFGVWVKPNGAPQFTGDRPSAGWEAICFLHKDGCKLRWNGGGRSSVFTENKINGPHPTCKPLRLVRGLIDLFTDPGDLVLDPYAGSGTTGVACLKAGRRGILIEKDEKYIPVIERRIRDAETPLFQSLSVDSTT